MSDTTWTDSDLVDHSRSGDNYEGTKGREEAVWGEVWQ